MRRRLLAVALLALAARARATEWYVNVATQGDGTCLTDATHACTFDTLWTKTLVCRAAGLENVNIADGFYSPAAAGGTGTFTPPASLKCTAGNTVTFKPTNFGNVLISGAFVGAAFTLSGNNYLTATGGLMFCCNKDTGNSSGLMNVTNGADHNAIGQYVAFSSGKRASHQSQSINSATNNSFTECAHFGWAKKVSQMYGTSSTGNLQDRCYYEWDFSASNSPHHFYSAYYLASFTTQLNIFARWHANDSLVTVAMTNGSPNVTWVSGSKQFPNDSLGKPAFANRPVFINDTEMTVQSVTDATHLVLTGNWAGVSGNYSFNVHAVPGSYSIFDNSATPVDLCASSGGTYCVTNHDIYNGGSSWTGIENGPSTHIVHYRGYGIGLFTLESDDSHDCSNGLINCPKVGFFASHIQDYALGDAVVRWRDGSGGSSKLGFSLNACDAANGCIRDGTLPMTVTNYTTIAGQADKFYTPVPTATPQWVQTNGKHMTSLGSWSIYQPAGYPTPGSGARLCFQRNSSGAETANKLYPFPSEQMRLLLIKASNLAMHDPIDTNEIFDQAFGLIPSACYDSAAATRTSTPTPDLTGTPTPTLTRTPTITGVRTNTPTPSGCPYVAITRDGRQIPVIAPCDLSHVRIVNLVTRTPTPP